MIDQPLARPFLLAATMLIAPLSYGVADVVGPLGLRYAECSMVISVAGNRFAKRGMLDMATDALDTARVLYDKSVRLGAPSDKPAYADLGKALLSASDTELEELLDRKCNGLSLDHEGSVR